MHTQLLLQGAIYWRERLKAAGADAADEPALARERAARLFGRAAHRLDPLPDWVIQACRELNVSPIADPGPEAAPAPTTTSGSSPQSGVEGYGAAAPAEVSPEPVLPEGSSEPALSSAPRSRLWPPSQLAEELEHWLLDAGPRRQIRLGLACIPGAAMLCREGSCLDLNLAALLQDPSGVAADPWFEALRDPLQRAQAAGWLQQLELREPVTSLYDSLSHHWRLGGVLPPAQLARIPALLHAWNRVLGPAQLQAQRLASSLVSGSSPAATTSLQVCLDPLELSALVAAADPIPAETALAEMRRQHRNDGFWQAEANPEAHPEADVLEALRLLQRDAGFYASSADALACLQRWRNGSLTCLERAQLWGAELSNDAVALLNLGQLITQHSGQLPCLRPRLPLQELLERMAGREVLYVGWATEQVLEQHRSGRAFRLFHDRVIVPYGLRAVAMPDSRHPRRPHGGFQDSLEQLIAVVEAEQTARPLDLLVVDQGAYRLPLLAAIEQRQGLAGVAPGPELLQLFGLDGAGIPRWREQDRDPAMWRLLA
jgi:hypothetical protein